jgi:hypothetical protein
LAKNISSALQVVFIGFLVSFEPRGLFFSKKRGLPRQTCISSLDRVIIATKNIKHAPVFARAFSEKAPCHHRMKTKEGKVI